jgi:hypothetical protein
MGGGCDKWISTMLFLQGHLQEDVYIVQPPAFVDKE